MMLTRRTFASLSLAAIFDQALRAQQCAAVPFPGAVGCSGPIPPGSVECRAALNFPSVVLADTLQQCPMWCWAASLSMVFKFFGHPLSQLEIVNRAFGGTVCSGAMPAQIAQALSSNWKDDNGNAFTCGITAAYDYAGGVFAINNAIIVNELVSQRPLIYCNTHHCMVICGVSYRNSMAGPVIDEVDVMDPWPSSPRIHPLSCPETAAANLGGQMTFLASVAIN